MDIAEISYIILYTISYTSLSLGLQSRVATNAGPIFTELKFMLLHIQPHFVVNSTEKGAHIS